MEETGQPDLISQMRARRDETARQWASAHADLNRRADEVFAVIPGTLKAPIPEAMAMWPKWLLLGILVEHFEGRHARAEAALSGDLLQSVCDLIPRVENEEASPDAIRSLVSEAQLGLAQANLASRARVTEEAARLAHYLTGHMRMRFRRGGRARLTAALAGHLEAILDAPLERTLEAERRVGDYQRVADELESKIAARDPAPDPSRSAP